MKEDEEDEENTFGVTRYPCMPSLVALQQMRNRLHLAFLGRKLMKWTMMATGRELRRIAMELDGVYKGFNEELRNAFILLARSRYFYPTLNKIVIEDVPKQAGVIVIPTTKAISSVKLMHYQIHETEAKPYVHLGIEKGGQTILETKNAWLELLKRLVLMLQLRSSFVTVEMSNRTATKRMNVVKKIVIPRTNVTITYIISELEEIAREEFHRLKKIKEKKGKGKMKEKKHEHEGLCPVCIEKLNDTQDIGFRKKIQKMPSPAVVREVFKQPDTPAGLSTSNSWDTGLDLKLEQRPESNMKLDYIKKHINELIVLGKSFVKSGVEYIDVEEFIIICENAKAKIEEIFDKDNESPGPYEEDYNTRLKNFKGHLRDVIELAKDFKEDTIIQPSVDNFINACEKVDQQLNKDSIKTPKISDKSRLQKLNSHIDDVVKITKEYKKQGLLSPSVEEFISSCKSIKSKIKEYSELESKADKIYHLKEHVKDLEILTDEVKNSGLQSKSMECFSKSCKEFNNKLENYTRPDRKEMALSNLLEQIDETIGLSMEAKDIGLVGESIEDLVKSSEKLKKRFTPLQDTKSKILQNLKTNIEDVMTIIDKYKVEGLVSDSVEDFLRTCEIARNKIEGYEVIPPNSEIKSSEPACFGNCVSCNEPFQTDIIMPNADAQVCKSCHKAYHEEKPSATPCDSCTDEIKEVKLPSDLSFCETCSNITEPPLDIPECPSSEQLSQQTGVYCDLCKKVIEGSHIHDPPAVDSKSGYYERKIRKLTKVTRSQNPDGTIREEKQTISIRKVRRDPTETSLTEDDDDDYEDDDDTSESSDDVETRVAICSLSHHNQRGFIVSRLIKSEMGLKTSPLMITGLRNCISGGALDLINDEDSESQLTINKCKEY